MNITTTCVRQNMESNSLDISFSSSKWNGLSSTQTALAIHSRSTQQNSQIVRALFFSVIQLFQIDSIDSEYFYCEQTKDEDISVSSIFKFQFASLSISLQLRFANISAMDLESNHSIDGSLKHFQCLSGTPDE